MTSHKPQIKPSTHNILQESMDLISPFRTRLMWLEIYGKLCLIKLCKISIKLQPSPCSTVVKINLLNWSLVLGFSPQTRTP